MSGEESQKDSPTIPSLFFQSASPLLGSTAYARTPSVMALAGALSGTTAATWQSSQYLPPISAGGATTAAHTEVAAPCETVFQCKAGLPAAASCSLIWPTLVCNQWDSHGGPVPSR